MPTHQPLPPDALYKCCDPASLGFETTEELDDMTEMIGQDRAVAAIELGTGLDLHGYNLFVLGQPGSGRHTCIRQSLEQIASGQAAPSDWCYVNNFDEPRKPRALELPAGRGTNLRDDIAQLIEEAHSAIPAAFESEDYRNQMQAVEEEAEQEHNKAFEEVKKHCEERGLGIIQTATGFAFVPLRAGKSIITPKEYSRLSEEKREQLHHDTEELSQEFRDMLKTIPGRVREVQKKIRKLNRDVALFAVGSLIDDLLREYHEFPAVLDFLRDMQTDIAENVELFAKPLEEQKLPLKQLLTGRLSAEQLAELPATRRYGVNLLVGHNDSEGAPVVFEDLPTYPYLVGQVEHVSRMGALVTDFLLVRAGALHRANGGYLVIDAGKVLLQPFSWDALKRALKARQINIQSLAQAYSVISTVTLDPEPIPLDLKVVLVGEPYLYYLLQALDPEFDELFKIAADFESDMERSDENVHRLARVIATIARREGLKPLDRDAVARAIEESGRHAGDSEMLSTRIRRLADIVREAHYWTDRSGNKAIGLSEIEQAIAGLDHRSGRIRDRLRREILRGTVMIDTADEQTGQVNGLAVAQIGDRPFGHPCRITARISLGSGKVIDIEREVELGGPIHSKGVLILANYLSSTYVTDRPLSLSASLVFEQSYSGVEGDSASAAELCALLSALGQIPIRQSLAITGSVNQHGQIQAIGGANEKIEGFFDICKARGLTGDQGVVIPASNVKHLMLNAEVRSAAADNKFGIYPVHTIDDCMEVLTGLEAGSRDDEGDFPAGSVNQLVTARLVDLADKRHAFESAPQAEQAEKSPDTESTDSD